MGGLYEECSDALTPELAAIVDAIATGMPNMHVARFDIRFASLSSLSAGREFKIIEINGAGSEAIEFFDPSVPFFTAYGGVLVRADGALWPLRSGGNDALSGSIPPRTDAAASCCRISFLRDLGVRQGAQRVVAFDGTNWTTIPRNVDSRQATACCGEPDILTASADPAPPARFVHGQQTLLAADTRPLDDPAHRAELRRRQNRRRRQRGHKAAGEQLAGEVEGHANGLPCRPGRI
jgi:hypothetical protein